MNPQERTVSKAFRDTIFEMYPQLNHRPYAALFCYLCFGTAKDDSFDNLLIPSSTLASFEQKQSYHRSKNYNGADFVERFSADTGIIVRLNGYYSITNRCRTVKKVILPDDVEALVERERRNMWIKQERVYFVDGRKYNPKIQREFYRSAQAEAMELILGTGCDGGPLHDDPQKNRQVFKRTAAESLFKNYGALARGDGVRPADARFH